jgi:ParB family chromosome partitioning protein
MTAVEEQELQVTPEEHAENVATATAIMAQRKPKGKKVGKVEPVAPVEAPAPVAVPNQIQYRVEHVDLVEIVAGENDRTVFEAEDIKQLADSIKAQGLAQPITVRPVTEAIRLARKLEDHVRYEIVAGERRFRAVTLLGDPTIPAIIRELTDQEAAGIMLAENVHRSDLNPMDEARAYDRRMKQFGWSAQDVANQAKVTTRRVQNRLALLRLIPSAQEMIQIGMFPVAWGLMMSELDGNRQMIAFKYWRDTDKPLLREFQAICGKLAEEQAQQVMFDSSNFMVAKVVEDHNKEYKAQTTRRFPVDEALPAFKRKGTLGESMEHYIAKLLEDGLSDVAAIAGRIYQGMLQTALACPPSKGSPLDEINRLAAEAEMIGEQRLGNLPDSVRDEAAEAGLGGELNLVEMETGDEPEYFEEYENHEPTAEEDAVYGAIQAPPAGEEEEF